MWLAGQAWHPLRAPPGNAVAFATPCELSHLHSRGPSGQEQQRPALEPHQREEVHALGAIAPASLPASLPVPGQRPRSGCNQQRPRASRRIYVWVISVSARRKREHIRRHEHGRRGHEGRKRTREGLMIMSANNTPRANSARGNTPRHLLTAGARHAR